MIRSCSSASGTSATTSSQPGQPVLFGEAKNLAPPSGQQPLRARGEFARHTDRDVIDRFQQDRIRLDNPSRMACPVAVLNAMSELSTEWNPPSTSVTEISTTGKPNGPFFAASSAASATAGMKFRGTEPPTILSMNSKPSPRGRGAMSIFTSANCPCPPLWLLQAAMLMYGATDRLFVGHLRTLR